MKLIIEIEPVENKPSDWKLPVIDAIDKALKDIETIAKYDIAINGLTPTIIHREREKAISG